MKDLFKLQDIVLAVLKADKNSRNSDMCLYYEVCKRVNREILSVPFGAVLADFNKYKVPNLESVGRVRRKLQEKYPELRATDKVTDGRMERQVMFEEYAKEVR